MTSSTFQFPVQVVTGVSSDTLIHFVPTSVIRHRIGVYHIQRTHAWIVDAAGHFITTLVSASRECWMGETSRGEPPVSPCTFMPGQNLATLIKNDLFLHELINRSYRWLPVDRSWYLAVGTAWQHILTAVAGIQSCLQTCHICDAPLPQGFLEPSPYEIHLYKIGDVRKVILP